MEPLIPGNSTLYQEQKDTEVPTHEQFHLWHHCHGCEASPIQGIRYHCESCPDGPDNDFCTACFNEYQAGRIIHPSENSLGATGNISEHHFTPYTGKPLSRYKPWFSVAEAQSAVPSIPYPFVVRPLFSAGLDSVIGGYAFTLRLLNRPYSLLLTALHVMDQMIKQKSIDATDANKHYSGLELPGIITEVTIFDVFTPNWMRSPLGSAGPMLILPEARTGDEEPYSYRDIAAFEIKDASLLQSPILAQRSPKLGEPVWVVSRSPQSHLQTTYPCTVVESTSRSLVFKYKDNEAPKYASGSPVLNQHGEVAAILVGGGEIEGKKFGHGNHAESIRHHLNRYI